MRVIVDGYGEHHSGSSHADSRELPSAIASNLIKPIEKYNDMATKKSIAAIPGLGLVGKTSMAGASLMLTQAERRCLVTVATTTGVNLASVVGVFMTGGWGRYFLWVVYYPRMHGCSRTAMTTMEIRFCEEACHVEVIFLLVYCRCSS